MCFCVLVLPKRETWGPVSVKPSPAMPGATALHAALPRSSHATTPSADTDFAASERSLSSTEPRRITIKSTVKLTGGKPTTTSKAPGNHQNPASLRLPHQVCPETPLPDLQTSSRAPTPRRRYPVAVQ